MYTKLRDSGLIVSGCTATQKQLKRMKEGTNRSHMNVKGECPVPQPRGCGGNSRHQYMLATTRWKAALQERTLESLEGKQLNVSSQEPLWQMMTSILSWVRKNTASKSGEILLSAGETKSGDAAPALRFPVQEGHGVSLAKGQEIDQIIGLSNMGGEAERIKIA